MRLSETLFTAVGLMPPAPEAPKPPSALAEAELERLIAQQWARARLAQDAAVSIDIPLMSIRDIRNRPRPGFWVEGVIPQSALVLVAGPPGIGKSFAALGMSLAIASGTQWLGRETKPGRVLYCAGEGVSGFPARVEAFERWNEVHVPDDAFMLAESGVNLSTEASVTRIAEIIKRERFALVVVDTFRKLSNVKDENDAALVTEVFRNALRLREACPDTSVLVVHHSNKSGDVNGSFAFQSEPDVIWTLAGNSNGFTMSSHTEDHGKVKDGEPDRLENLRLRPIGESAVLIDGPMVVLDPLDGLESSGPITTADLIAHIRTIEGCSKPTAERTIKNLTESGRIRGLRKGVYAVER